MAAGIVSKPTEDGDNKDMVKSIATVLAEAGSDAKDILAEYIYTREGIWNAENSKVYPLRRGIRT